MIHNLYLKVNTYRTKDHSTYPLRYLRMNPSGWHLEESILGDLLGPLLSPPPPPQDLLFPLTVSLAAGLWLAPATAAAPEGAEN